MFCFNMKYNIHMYCIYIPKNTKISVQFGELSQTKYIHAVSPNIKKNNITCFPKNHPHALPKQ